MFFHPLTIIGLTALAFGWLLLIGGNAVGLGMGIINLHTLFIASALIITGCAFMVMGVVAGATARLLDGRMLLHQSANPETRAKQLTGDVAQIEPEEVLRRALQEKGLT